MTIYQNIASVADVEDFASSLPDAYLKCRVWNHHFEHNDRLSDKDERARWPEAVWASDLVCSHGCGVRGLLLADGEGYIIVRKVDYSGAPEYVMVGKGRIGRAGKAVMRRAFFTTYTKSKRSKK